MSEKVGVKQRSLTTRVILLPRDTNAHGTIFGGIILSHIDLAGAAEARRYTTHRVVTVAMRQVEFRRPVYVGDLVSFYTQLERIGRTSITVRVEVEAQRASDATQVVPVTEAVVTYVAVDEAGRKVPVASS